MPEYADLKNAELQALLKDRGLPTTGKKADLVERLTKDDEQKAGAAPAASKLNPEDEIDWDDEGDEVAAEPKAAASAAEKAQAAIPESDLVAKAGGTGQPPNPQAVPNQVADIDPSTTDDLSVKEPAGGAAAAAAAEETKEPAPSYTKGLAATNIDEEIEKRKARAKKFGMNIDEDEGLKKLERAKKFGETGPPLGLDEALPERRKRGREDNEDGGRNKRRSGGRFGGRRGRGPRDGGRKEERSKTDGSANWMNDSERAKAEARKAKFAKA